jgi:uncharacterized FAD-dependent dehydrogenase
MCPGGTVVAATSEPGRVVTNGMSQYSRNERNANAGMVVGIDPRDYPTDAAAVAATLGAEFGELPSRRRAMNSTRWPASCCSASSSRERLSTLGGGTYEAPGQLVGDFWRASRPPILASVLPSYKPGVKLTNLHDALPRYAIEAMQEALPVFGRKIRATTCPTRC